MASSNQANCPTALVVQTEDTLGMGPSQLNIGDLAHVTQPTNVWSTPGTKMSALEKANTFDQYAVTGVFVEYNGAAWAPIGDRKSGTQEGWVLAEHLARTNSSNPVATPIYMSRLRFQPRLDRLSIKILQPLAP